MINITRVLSLLAVFFSFQAYGVIDDIEGAAKDTTKDVLIDPPPAIPTTPRHIENAVKEDISKRIKSQKQ